MIKKSFIMIIAAVAMFISCVNDGQQVELQLNLSQVTLVEGETVMLSAAIAPASSTASIQWRSLDNSVATVDNGLVLAVNPGQTWVSASAGSVETGCLVTVSEQKVLSIDRKVIYMMPDGVQTLTVTYDPSFTSEVVWTSTDTDIATVEDGVVTALADGEVDIIASIEDGRYDIGCHVYVMSTVGNENGDLFIMQGAEGNGSSWDNAGGEDLLRSLLNVSSDVSSASRVDGKKIHIAEGKYDISRDSLLRVEIQTGLSVTLLGGYSASLSGTSVVDRDPATRKSVITASDSRILTIGSEDIDITLDGIVLDRGFAGAESYGGAIDCNFTGKLTLNDCSFTNNVAGYGGGAVNVTSGEVHFNRCSFVSNGVDAAEGSPYDSKCTGGAIRVSGESSEVYVDECRFAANYALASGDVHVEGGALAYLNRCMLSKAAVIGDSGMGSANMYPGCSITADAGLDNTSAKTTLCVLNSTIYDAESTSYTTGSPQISIVSANALLANTTIYGFSMGNVRVDKRSTVNPDNVHIYASLLLQTKKGKAATDDGANVNLQKDMTMRDYCSVMELGKNGWKMNADNKLATAAPDRNEEGDFNFEEWDESDGRLKWSMKDGRSISDYAEKSVLSEKIAAAFPDFDEWLRTVEEDPYGIDQNGSPRNPAKMNPGAWDPNLETAGNE